MNAKIIDGRVSINIADLLGSLTTEEKRHVADALACEDDIIRDVADQLLVGWTEAGSHGGKMTGEADPHTPLDKARRELALRAGEVQKKEVEALVAALIRAKVAEEKYSKWGTALYFRLCDAGMHAETFPAYSMEEQLVFEVVPKIPLDERQRYAAERLQQLNQAMMGAYRDLCMGRPVEAKEKLKMAHFKPGTTEKPT